MTAKRAQKSSRPVHLNEGEAFSHPGREHHYTSRQVCRMAGITHRQLDHWCRTGMAGCVYLDGDGFTWLEGSSGLQRRFDADQAIRVIAAAWMLRQGLDWPTVRKHLRDGRVATVTTRPLPEVDP